MPHLENCLNHLRRLIAEGNVDKLYIVDSAIKGYVEATPPKARISGLRLLQQDLIAQRNGASGDQRNFADIVILRIEQKLSE